MLRLLLPSLLLLHAATALGEPLRALTILAHFPDARSSIERERYERFFNDEGYREANAARSVRAHLRELSNGRLELATTVTEWVELPHPVAHYEAMEGGAFGDGPEALIRDAVAALDARGFDFTPFDNDGDGVVELLGVVHRGSNPDFGGGAAPDWSTVPAVRPALEVDGVRVERGWMITDSNPAFGTITTLGGVVHEMVGHALCNVPDLNGWAAGAWGPMYWGDAFEPTHLSAWLKLRCGWSRVVDVEDARSLTLTPVEQGGELYRLWIDPYREREYFLLENRQRLGADGGLPGSGLLIWHVDEWADQSHFLRLEQADGRDDLALVAGFGNADAGDPFPGESGNRAFTPDTLPSSAARDGTPSGIRVEAIAEVEGSVRAEVTPASGLRGVTLAYDESYPRWAWNWSPEGGHQEGERVAVRFTSTVGGTLAAIKFNYWGGPPEADSPKPFTLRVHEEFAEDGRSAGAVLREVSGELFGREDLGGGWYRVELVEPLPLTAGERLVVSLEWAEPIVSIDYLGRSSGNSFYLAPGESEYSPLFHDLRLRAVIESDEPASPPVASYADGLLTLPRVAVSGIDCDFVDVGLRLEADGRWALARFSEGASARTTTTTTFDGRTLTLPQASARLPQGTLTYRDILFQLTEEGRFQLLQANSDEAPLPP